MLTARLGVSSRLRLEEEQEASYSPLLRSKPLEVLSILPRPSPIPSAVFLNPKRAGESRRKVLISWDSKKQRGLFKNEGGVFDLLYISLLIYFFSLVLIITKTSFFKNRELKKKSNLLKGCISCFLQLRIFLAWKDAWQRPWYLSFRRINK